MNGELAGLVASVPGFMPEDEGAAMHAAARGAGAGTWLEIGTYCGKSTLILADAARAADACLVTIDHHHGSEENQPGWEYHDPGLVDPRTGRLDTLPVFRRILDDHVADVVSPIVAPTQLVARWWSVPVQLLFLDGGHTEEVAQHDFHAFARHVVPGGLLLVHDVFPDPAHGGRAPWHVVQAALDSGRFTEMSVHGSLRVLLAQR